MKLRYFTKEELQCRHCGELQLAPGFGHQLDELRDIFGRPMRVTSGSRCAEHNKAIGGAFRSMHLIKNPSYPLAGGSFAVDIDTPNSEYRAALLNVALMRGWTVGIHKVFTHLDLRSKYTDLPRIAYLY